MRIKYYLFLLLVLTFAGKAISQNRPRYVLVQARTNAKDSIWKTYEAQTLEGIPGFKKKNEPKLNEFGSWATAKRTATGFFRTERINNRWWLVDPQGYPYYSKGIAVFTPGGSENQKKSFQKKFGNDQSWVKEQGEMLQSYGFNGFGAWSAVDIIRKAKKPIPYTVIVNPMGKYRSEHLKKYGGKYEEADWHGYRYNLVMVFDPEFQNYLDEVLSVIKEFKNDKYLIGYFTDNELPWRANALDLHLTKLSKKEPAYIAAKEWLDIRKKRDASISDITPDDRAAFFSFYFETYLKKVTDALRKFDPNHLYLGCRFHAAVGDLTNEELFRVAGKYMDVISINHYKKWQPEQSQMNDWAAWSGKPFLITEWYTKGEDSGLANTTGAGWNVKTQLDRGYFYQNFTIELLKNKSCVGWHWFTYQDNDPQNQKTDESNRDSNKGIVDSNYNGYLPLLKKAKAINTNVWNLIHFFDQK